MSCRAKRRCDNANPRSTWCAPPAVQQFVRHPVYCLRGSLSKIHRAARECLYHRGLTLCRSLCWAQESLKHAWGETMSDWPKRCRLARAFRWEYGHQRLKLAQLLGQRGVCLAWLQKRDAGSPSLMHVGQLSVPARGPRRHSRTVNAPPPQGSSIPLGLRTRAIQFVGQIRPRGQLYSE
jgi:hypothetical protein